MRRLTLASCVVLLSLATCGDDDGDRPGVIQPKRPEPTAISSGEQRLSAVRVDSRREQYRLSKRICRQLGPARIAYENGEAGTPIEIAQKWSERTGVPAWRRESFNGCLDGFAARRAQRR